GPEHTLQAIDVQLHTEATPKVAWRRALVWIRCHQARGLPMPVRTGRQYLEGLRSQEREVWLGGERVCDVTNHPGLASGAKAIASLYDMQCSPELREVMTYKSPTTGDPVGLSFIIPRTHDDLIRRREMMLRWARATCGMMGRSPDFMNVTFAAWA